MEQNNELKITDRCEESNIRSLAAGIIMQACSDYEFILKNGTVGERKISETKEHLEDWFLKNCPPYGGYLGIQGRKMLEQMQENFRNYGSVKMPLPRKGDK